jgi:hypothetical protein
MSSIEIVLSSYLGFFAFSGGENIISYDKFIANPEKEFANKTKLSIPSKVFLRTDRKFSFGDFRGYTTKELNKTVPTPINNEEMSYINKSPAMDLWNNLNRED